MPNFKFIYTVEVAYECMSMLVAIGCYIDNSIATWIYEIYHVISQTATEGV